jgi:hypothetical protein
MRDRRRAVRLLERALQRSERDAGDAAISRIDRRSGKASSAAAIAMSTTRGEPIDPSPTIDQAVNGGFPWLEIRCSRCKTPSDVDLAGMKHPQTTFVHDLVSRLQCQKCAKVGRRPSATLLQLAWQPRHARPEPRNVAAMARIIDRQFSRTMNGIATVQTATGYLETLNSEQRRAVEHGAEEGLPACPLLVIAGAGSGKTNTLAHRVAHLIVEGADPRRILLMTFSRRAASEMTKRVERIARKVMGDNAGIMTDALTWAGTYHGIGARLLREYAEQIGLDPAFTIHDREDSADLMNLIRHEKGLSKTESRFPTKGTCLSIYSRCVNAEIPIEQAIGTS